MMSASTLPPARRNANSSAAGSATYSRLDRRWRQLAVIPSSLRIA
jgi:hypothetical protein